MALTPIYIRTRWLIRAMGLDRELRITIAWATLTQLYLVQPQVCTKFGLWVQIFLSVIVTRLLLGRVK